MQVYLDIHFLCSFVDNLVASFSGLLLETLRLKVMV